MNDRSEPDVALDQAMRWLARREYSIYELEQRLAGKGFSEKAVAEALELLKSRDLVSDRRFAESLVRKRVERGYGPVKIAHELAAKGVDDALADELVNIGPGRWIARLQEVWEKRFGEAPDSYREWTRQARSLQSRGFTAEQIRRVVPDVDPGDG